MMRRVMGLDASTTTIGVAVLDYQYINNVLEVKLVHFEFFKPPKKGDIFERLNRVQVFIKQMIEIWKPNDIALEDIILFMKGFSTAKTVSGLAVLNRTVGLTVYNSLGKPPHLLNVMKIRHSLKRDKKLPGKEEIPDLVASYLGIKFPYILNKKQQKIKENFDLADAMAVGLAFIKLATLQ